MMARRFDYDRWTSDQFNSALSHMGMQRASFCRITGANKASADAWSSGVQDIPPWVPVLLTVFQNCPGAIPEARKVAAMMICTDRERPEYRYPFLNREDQL